MMTRLKAFLVLARKNVWGVLLVLYPFADQIIAGIEGWLPAMAPYLGPAVFRYMGLAIVVVKVALQAYRGWQQLGSLLAKKEGT
jgi:hypothetical protein